MKEAKKKDETSTTDEMEHELQKSLDDFAKIIAEDLHEEKRNEIEPFEAYTQRVKAKIHADITQFRARFVKGYNVLLNELQKKK